MNHRNGNSSAPALQSLPDMMLDCAAMLSEQGHREDAETLFERAVELSKAGAGDDPFAGEKTSGLPWLAGHSSRPFDAFVDMMKSVHELASVAPPANGMDGDMLIKAMAGGQQAVGVPHRFSEAMYALGAYSGIKDPFAATNVTFYFFRQLARHPIIRAIHVTRSLKAKRYARPVPLDSHEPGFAVRLANHRAPMTPAARKEVERFQQLLQWGGYYWLPNGGRSKNPYTREIGIWDGLGEEKALGMENSLSAIIEDAQTYGFSAIRMEPGRDEKRYPIAFWSPADTANIRITDPRRYRPQIRKSGLPIIHIEVGLSAGTAHNVVREYVWNEMARIIYDPRRDRLSRGYGYSPLESLLEILAYLILDIKFFGEWFSNNHVPPAILEIMGNPVGVSQRSLDALRAKLMHTIGGAGAFWKLLYLMFPAGTGGVNVKPLRPGLMGAEAGWARDFLVLLIVIACAVYAIDPEEVGFQGFKMQRAALSERSPEVIYEHSQDKGFRNYMLPASGFFTEQICWAHPNGRDFEHAFVNLFEEHDAESELQEATTKLAIGFTPNEIYDEMDRARVRHPVDAILFGQFLRSAKRERYETDEEWREAAEKAYERECQKRGYPIVWSQAWDKPVGNPGMMQIAMNEDAQLQQALAPQQPPMSGGELGAEGTTSAEGQSGLVGEDANAEQVTEEEPIFEKSARRIIEVYVGV